MWPYCIYIAYNTFLTFGTYCTFDIYITFSTYFIYMVLITHIHYLVASTEWVKQCDSQMIYERKLQHQVFYVIHVTSILGQLPVVPVGDTGTIPYSINFYAQRGCRLSWRVKSDGSRWWYINTWAL